jgi:hypothetical protein
MLREEGQILSSLAFIHLFNLFAFLFNFFTNSYELHILMGFIQCGIPIHAQGVHWLSI